MSALAKLSGWRARPLDGASKSAKFRITMDQHAERVLFGHAALKAAWIIFGMGCALLAISIAGWVKILSLPVPEPPVFVADRTSGYVGPATSLSDAAMTFPESTDHERLERYIEEREGWIDPDVDRSADYLVKLMSCRDEQTRYAEWRKSPSSPMNAIGKEGKVFAHNFRFHPLPFAGKDNKTKRYLVQYDRIISLNAGGGSTKGWSATVDFSYRPEAKMRQSDRNLNTAGFQACGYNSEPDTN